MNQHKQPDDHSPGVRILVPLDGSRSAERVIETAEHFAGLMGAEILLLNVTDARGLPGTHPAGLATPKEYLENLAARTTPPARAIVISAQTVVRGILSVSKTENASLVLMSTHGAGASHDQPLSSVGRDLLRTSKVPVMFVGVAMT